MRVQYYAGGAVQTFTGEPNVKAAVTEGAVGVTGRASLGNLVDYRERITGLFTAPVTGEYQFIVAGDDRSEVYVSPNTSVAHLARVSVTNSFNVFPAPLWLEQSQVSGNISMVAGQQYAFRMQHWQGSGPGFIRAGVRIWNTPAAGGCRTCAPPALWRQGMLVSRQGRGDKGVCVFVSGV